jgi:hypothetical protein
MAFRKVYIAIDCANEAEFEQVQNVAKVMSNIFRFRGDDVLAMYPIVAKNGEVISATVRTIAQEGMRGVAKMVPYLIKNIKK